MMQVKPEFETLIQDYSQEILGYLWRLFHVQEDAEDCLQETFLKAFKAYHRFDGPGNPRAWLYRIATNTAYSRLKRENLAYEKSHLLAEVRESVQPVEEQVQTNQLIAGIRMAVDNLPPNQRMALIMRKYQEMPYHEIAVALDCSVDAARANVYQGLQNLRRQFTTEVESEVTS